MNDTNSDDHRRSIERLIENAIESMGPLPPDQLPHALRRRFRAQLADQPEFVAALDDILEKTPRR